MSGYIGVEPVPQVTKVRTFGTLVEASSIIPVAGGFSPGNIEVYINGDYVLPTDYDESDGLNVVFGITLTAGTDYVVIEARQFLVADTWSKAEADTRYAEITGGADANFSVMPQVGGEPMVESGSNADGSWVRYADGTIFQFGTVVTPTAANRFASFPLSFGNATNHRVILTLDSLNIPVNAERNPRLFRDTGGAGFTHNMGNHSSSSDSCSWFAYGGLT